MSTYSFLHHSSHSPIPAHNPPPTPTSAPPLASPSLPIHPLLMFLLLIRVLLLLLFPLFLFLPPLASPFPPTPSIPIRHLPPYTPPAAPPPIPPPFPSIPIPPALPPLPSLFLLLRKRHLIPTSVTALSRDKRRLPGDIFWPKSPATVMLCAKRHPAAKENTLQVNCGERGWVGRVWKLEKEWWKWRR